MLRVSSGRKEKKTEVEGSEAREKKKKERKEHGNRNFFGSPFLLKEYYDLI